MNNEIILPHDERAATKKTITVWEARGGKCFSEDDEEIARFAGCTHRPCPHCGTVTEKHWTACATCRDKRATERWRALPAEPWAGQSVYSDLTDQYYWSPTIEELRDAAFESDCKSLDDLRLHFLEPQLPRPLEPDDLWEDLLPEDQYVSDVSPELSEAIEAVNEIITKKAPVLSYIPAQRRPTFPDPVDALNNRSNEDE